MSSSSIRVVVGAVLFTTLSVASATPDADAVIGAWEGESKCTVPDSPCRDEHAIYTVKQDGGGFTMQADKVVSGERVNMGTLPCRYDLAGKRLTCVVDGAKPADWEFVIAGEAMTGTLTLRTEHQLYRRVQARRTTPAKKR